MPPASWVEDAENRLGAVKPPALLRDALALLPDRQREIVLLRDVQGMNFIEVCQILAITEADQRFLLHRGRNRLCQALESELKSGRP